MLRSLSILHNTSVDNTSGAYYNDKTGRVDIVNYGSGIEMEHFIQHRFVPADNSCLFRSIR